MGRHLPSLLVVALLLGVVGAGAWGQRVSACSCTNFSALGFLASQEVIVGGEPVDRREEIRNDGNGDEPFIVWSFRVDERYRGDTPPVIELRADARESSCGPPPEITAGIVTPFVTRRGEYFVSPGCGPVMVDPDVVARLFDSPALEGSGPPAAIVAAEADGHNAAVVDADGRPLRYLAGPGRTFGLAVCPGGERFVQIRSTDLADEASSLELVVWSFDGWEASEPVALRPALPAARAVTLHCHDEAAGRTTIAWTEFAGVTEVIDGTVTSIDISPDDPLVLGAPHVPNQLRLGGRVIGATNVAGQPVLLSTPQERVMSIGVDGGEWLLSVSAFDDLDDDTSRFGVRPVRIAADATETAGALIPDVTLGWPVSAIVPEGVAAGIDMSGVAAPGPLFERSGRKLPVAPTSDSVAAAIDDGGTVPPTTSAEPATDAGDTAWARWVLGAGLLAVLGLAVVIVRRRGARDGIAT